MSSPLPALRLGVTGHRSDKLREDTVARLTPVIATTLERLTGLASLQVVSPLAEGADRLVARLALQRGAKLIVPLPLSRDDYLRDFSSAASRDEFGALLARAAEVIDPNTNGGGSRNAAYAAAGASVVDRSDILIAIWDGEDAAGEGGTAEIVKLARQRGKPVLWLPLASSEPQLLLKDGAVTTGAVDALMNQAATLLQSTSARDRHLFGPGPKRVLALDGGGVRGILSIAMLEKLEKIVEEIEGRPVLLGDWFDLIGGTSTGAIIGTFLALGYRAAEVRAAYQELVPRVFKQSGWRIAGFRSKFDSRRLSEELQKFLGDLTIGSDKLRTGLCITTKRLDSGSAWVIVNNPCGMYWATPPDNSFTGNQHYRLANLLQASTAAPHYFEPQRIEIAPNTPPGLFVDGGVSPHNNPSLYLFLVATLPQYGLCWPTGPENLNIVSMGTGTFRFRLNPNLPKPILYAGTTIQALASQIIDSQQLVLAMMSLFGETPMAWTINSELGDLGATPPPGGKPLFKFTRYDARLETAWLKDELGVTVDESALAQLRRLDAAANLAQFYELGQRAAEKQIRAEHFTAAPHK